MLSKGTNTFLITLYCIRVQRVHAHDVRAAAHAHLVYTVSTTSWPSISPPASASPPLTTIRRRPPLVLAFHFGRCPASSSRPPPATLVSLRASHVAPPPLFPSSPPTVKLRFFCRLPPPPPDHLKTCPLAFRPLPKPRSYATSNTSRFASRLLRSRCTLVHPARDTVVVYYCGTLTRVRQPTATRRPSALRVAKRLPKTPPYAEPTRAADYAFRSSGLLSPRDNTLRAHEYKQ